MVDTVISIAKWVLKVSFILAVALALIVLLGIIATYLTYLTQLTILSDIFLIVQVWLPFNLSVLLIWMGITVSAYLAYRLAVMSFNMINAWIGH